MASAQTQKFNFNEALHAYTMGSVTVPSVTQIFKDVGIGLDIDNVHPAVVKKIERKRLIGTEVHKAAQFMEENALDWDSLDPAVTPYVIGFERFLNDTGWKSSLIEYQTVSQVDGLHFGMTIDREGRFVGDQIRKRSALMGLEPDKPTILDLKCTYDAEVYWGLQTAAYELGLRNEQASEKRQRGVLWLKKDGGYKVLPHTDESEYRTFVSALHVSHYKRQNGFAK